MLRKRIGDILLEKGLITSAQLTEALKEQEKTGRKIGQLLVEKGIITEEQLIEAVSERLQIPKISLASLVIDPMVVGMVPVEMARRYALMPIFKIGKIMTVAMAEPLNIIAIDELKYITKCDIKRVIASHSEINAAIDQYYSVADSMSGVIGSYPGAKVDEKTAQLSESVSESEREAPVVKLVNLIITQAVKDKASDIHIEPDESQLRIRYRINGVMREEASPPKSLQAEIISRIKVAANMDVSEKRLPQDGRLMMKVDGSNIDLRISTLPTIHGEKVVIRILDRRILNIGMEQLGFSPNLLEAWKRVIRKKEGLVLLTGPTSSGKTTTLYAALQEVNSIEKNIITIEDPVEYSIPLVNQVQTNERAGLTFASILRYILRQNPDIIMIGEIRDVETASMAIRSALTGHLVLSTLHTNDAPSSINRLIDMGIENYLVASSLKGILAQRLLRTNCPHCAEEYKPQDVHIRFSHLDTATTRIRFMKGSGCTRCRMTGYMGQIGIYELVEVDDTISEMIISGASEIQIRNYAGTRSYKPLFQAGLEKVAEGKVCLEELLRVTSMGEQSRPAASLEKILINA
ncbi:MAG: ATPase, T2SS/T4P/T4SS family [Candidatus Zixiibacteriota bacterium]|jgi:type IV pilus assembly protein PilB